MYALLCYATLCHAVMRTQAQPRRKGVQMCVTHLCRCSSQSKLSVLCCDTQTGWPMLWYAMISRAMLYCTHRPDCGGWRLNKSQTSSTSFIPARHASYAVWCDATAGCFLMICCAVRTGPTAEKGRLQMRVTMMRFSDFPEAVLKSMTAEETIVPEAGGPGSKAVRPNPDMNPISNWSGWWLVLG